MDKTSNRILIVGSALAAAVAALSDEESKKQDSDPVKALEEASSIIAESGAEVLVTTGDPKRSVPVMKVPKRVRGPFTPGQTVEHKVRGPVRLTRDEAVELNRSWFAVTCDKMREDYAARGVPLSRQKFPQEVVTAF